MRNQYKMLGRKPEIKMPLGRQKKTNSKLGNGINTYLKETGYQVSGEDEGEVRPRTDHEGPEGSLDTALLFQLGARWG
jgi:hypothetical protein